MGIVPLAATLLLAGCAADSQTEQGQTADGLRAIRLTATVGDGARADTRAATGIQSAQFDEGEEFYAYFPSGVSVGNVSTQSGTKFTTTNTSGATHPETQPYFNAGTDNVRVHAYYGKSGGSSGTQVTNSTSSFSVALDQTEPSGYKASDLMYATATVTKSGLAATGNLQFSHKMAKIIVNATMGSGITEITAVKIVGGSKTINIATPLSCTLGTSLSDDNSSANITVFSGTHTSGTLSCAALIPPQQVPAEGSTATNFLQIETNAGTVTYSLNGKQFDSNNVYTFNVTLTASQAGTTVAFTNWADNGNATVTAGYSELNVQTSGSFSYAADGSAHYPSVLSVNYTRYGTTTPTPTTLSTSTDYDVKYYQGDGTTEIASSSITAAGTYYMAVVGKGSYLGAKWMKKFTLANAVSGTVEVGNYLYADGFCDASAEATGHGDVVGVVFSTTVSNADQALGYTHGYAVALKDASTSAKWSSQTSLADPGVVDLSFPYQNTMAQAELIMRGDLNGRANTANATYVGTTNAEAFYAAKNYSADVSGFANSGWFLPSIGQLWAMCKELGGMDESQIGNSTYSNWGSEDRTYGVWYANPMADKVRTKLNSYLTPLGSGKYDYFSGGKSFGTTNNGTGTDCTGNESFASAQTVCYWSSSEWSAGYAFNLDFGYNGNLHFGRNGAKSYSFRVRAVLAF